MSRTVTPSFHPSEADSDNNPSPGHCLSCAATLLLQPDSPGISSTVLPVVGSKICSSLARSSHKIRITECSGDEVRRQKSQQSEVTDHRVETRPSSFPRLRVESVLLAETRLPGLSGRTHQSELPDLWLLRDQASSRVSALDHQVDAHPRLVAGPVAMTFQIFLARDSSQKSEGVTDE